MRLFRRRTPVPLLAKELVEQAARRRTYVVRAVYALLLFVFFFIFFYSEVASRRGDPFLMMGAGRDLFEFLVAIQFGGILIFLPAMMAGVLAHEKERDSLPLLFLTGLRPWEIVLQKYAGRLIPMLTYLLLSLPLLAIAYGFGGVSKAYLFAGIYMLLLTCLQVGALALMFSAFCVTTVQAFVCSYVLGAAFYFAPLIANFFLYAILDMDFWDEDVLFAFLPPYVFAVKGSSVAGVLLHSIPVALSALVFLVMARVFVVRRAFVSRRSRLLQVFNRLDVFWHKVNRVTGGIVLIKDRQTLPERDPIAWRETNKAAMGKPTHLVRLLLLIEAPVAFLAALVILTFGIGADEALSALLYLLWPLVALILTAQSVNAFVSERTRQTLDVLLATPIRGPDIVRQKSRGARRLALVLAVPLATVVLLRAWVLTSWSDTWTYLLSAGLAIAVYLPLLVWFSLWISLRSRSRPRAVIVALIILVIWCVAPVLLLALVDDFTGTYVAESPFSYLFLLSPASAVAFAETEEWEWFFDEPVLVPIVVNYLWYGAIAFCFRTLCLIRADRYLGRVPSPGLFSRTAEPTHQTGGS